jgi:hypothetical protein
MSNEGNKTPVTLSTLDHVPGREISKSLGIVIGIGNVAFGPITATKARTAYSKAISDLGHGLDPETDAVLGLKVAATSAGFPFFRPHTIVVTGTAVKLK